MPVRARALSIALILLAAFVASGLASATFGLQGLATSGVTSSVNGELLAPVGGTLEGRDLGQGAGNATAPVQVGLPARVIDFTPMVPTATRTFPTTDFTDPEAGPRQGTTDWRVVSETGNAAELWFTITSTGRILDLGGRYVNYSDDQGLTWKSVRPQEELVNAEGSVIQAPNGDVVALTWDPYSGDRVVTYKFTKATNAWTYMYMAQHTPFWDRPSIEVIPGEFTDEFGDEVPYLTYTNGFPHTHWQYSYDGLNYTGISNRSEEASDTASISSWLDVEPDPMFDYIQPNQDLQQGLIPKFAPLGDGNAWSENLMFTAEDMKWHDWTTPEGEEISGSLQVDSRGWLHNVQRGSGGFLYRVSTDGARSWNELEVSGGQAADFRANGAAGIAAVAASKSIAGKGVQDYVYKIDISTPEPKLLLEYLIGEGNDSRSGGLGFYGGTGGHRWDFSSVGVFPDGRVAVTFMDAKTKIPFPSLANPATCAIEDQPDGPAGVGSPCRVVAPMLAIEQDTTIPG
jgi:hypothetical protein